MMSPIGMLLGNMDFSNLFVVLKECKVAGPYGSLAAAKAAGAVSTNIEAFINTAINFIILGLCYFPPDSKRQRDGKEREGADSAFSE